MLERLSSLLITEQIRRFLPVQVMDVTIANTEGMKEGLHLKGQVMYT
jgi:hypothetical protein